MPLNKMVGNDVVVNVRTGGTDAAPVFSQIAFQRGVSIESSREMIDASHKGSDFTENVYGRQSGTISLDGLMPNPEVGAVATHDALYDAMKNKTEVVLQYVKKGTASDGSDDTKKQAKALIGTISEEGPDNDVATISCEFTLQQAFQAVV